MPPERRQEIKARLEAMPPERWKQINDLLDAVLEQPPQNRSTYLDAHSEGDPALHQEVKALLASYEEADRFLEAPASPFLEAVFPIPEPPSLEGQRVGVYRILNRIGQGGMGAVYLAERDDVQKKVALKLVRDGLASPEHRQRFLVERRLLARLEHPNIARLLDAGVTEQGAPYFAMEYVEGQPLDAYCDSQRRTVIERLELFQTVCRVVHYAHQNLVVHRDLKPSNILVTEDGDVRLLDFGIAKLLEEETEEQAILTQPGARLMTPAYASPEQLRAEPVTTATDIYSLGVILYELLTGQRPFDDEASNLEHAYSDRALIKPSTAVTTKREDTTTVSKARSTTVEQLRRRLSGDLDAICLKALRREPERRYRSAEQFLEDIRRHLDGLPVNARKDTVGYRLTKFARRNRGVVAAAALVVLSLLGGIVATSRQAHIAEAERDRAEQVVAILPELFWSLEPGELQNTAVTPEEMLDRGLEQIEEKLANQPEIQARVLTLATDLYLRLAAYKKAEAAARKALDLRKKRYGEEHQNVAASMAMLAQSLDKQGNYDEAEPLHRNALAMRRDFLGNEHLDVATSLHNLAMLVEIRGAYDEAEQLNREALAIRQKLGAEPRDIAFTQANLAVVFYYKGEYDEAEQLTREALALRRTTLGQTHPDVANSLATLATILQARDEDADVEPLYRQGLSILKKTHGDEHPYIAYTLNSLGLALHKKTAYEEANACLLEALAILRKIHGEEHFWVSIVLHNLALVQADQGNVAQAESMYREVITMRRRLLGSEHPELAFSLYGLGQMLMKNGLPGEAEPLLREAFVIRQNALPQGHKDIALSQNMLGACLAALNRHDEAEPLLRDGFESLRGKLGLEHAQSQTALRRLVDFLEEQGRQEEAARYSALLADQDALQP